MPNLVDIVEIAEALESKSVFVAADRCVVVRNRNAQCRKCEHSCPVDAFTLQGNTLSLDSKACVSCGACTVVCPTEALIPLRPLDEELAHAIADACLSNEGTAVFACSRIASKRLVDPSKFAEVPCLARIEESILLELAAQGVDRIMVVDGDCSSCKYHACDRGITASVDSANTLLRAVGSSVEVKRASAFPPTMVTESTSGLYGVDRRGFFTKARGTAKEAAEKTVVTMLKSKQEEKVASLRDRLGISSDGTLPQFEAKRRMYILDSLDRIGEPQINEVETRLWGNVVIDKELCSACNMCAVFCPTGALKKTEIEGEEHAKPLTALEFSAADCVQCHTCEDVCLKKCLKIEPVISLKELFDFEPRIIPLPDAPEKNSLISKLRR